MNDPAHTFRHDRPDSTLRPHKDLTSYYSETELRQRFVDDIFDRSAQHYDRICNLMSFGSGLYYRRTALQRGGMKKDMRVLDVGTGTGLVCSAALAAGIQPTRLFGVDPSEGMLAHHRERARIRLTRASGDLLPIADASFDFLVMGYALRHVADLNRTFAEYLRVLQPGGRLLLLEITRPRTRVGFVFARMYFGKLLPWITKVTTGSAEARRLMDYYWATIDACVPPAAILKALEDTGFSDVRRVTKFGIFSEYQARRPVSR